MEGQANEEVKAYDLLIAGAGMAGVLAAARLSQAYPKAKIALIDKSPAPGGRLRSSQRVPGEWNSGLAAISPELYDYVSNTLRANPRGRDLAELIVRRQERIGLLSGSSLDCLSCEELFTPAAAKLL